MLLAQNLETIQSGAFPSNSIPIDLGTLIGNTLPYVFATAALALLIYLILGGFQLMTSRGDPKAAQGAQAKITNAIIGFVLIFLAYFIVQIFGQIFGLQNTIFGQIFRFSFH